MNILVVSDSHGNKNAVKKVLSDIKYDSVLFLGDGLSDFEDYKQIDIHKVAGNCDWGSEEALEKVIFIAGKKIMITHGHNYKVKWGLSLLMQEGYSNGYDLVCYGHTHSQSILFENGCYYINPGALKNGKALIIHIDKNFEMQFEPIEIV